MNRSSGLSAAAAAFALALALGAGPAAAQIAAPETFPLKDDQDFINQAVSAGILEVREARIALQRSQNPAVQAFANRMIADHTEGNTKLAAIAKQEKLTYPDNVTQDQAAEMRALGQLSGSDFDQAYLQDQLKAHQQAVGLFTAESTNSTDQYVKSMAANLLPALQSHLQMVQQLVAQQPGSSAK